MIKKFFNILIILSILCTACLTFTSCGTAKTDAEYSPRLENINVDSYSEGTEESQYVTVDLIFDRQIAVTDDKCDSLRITIADRRIGDDEYTLEKGDENNTARFKISVRAITEGILRIQPVKEDKSVSEIRSDDKKYAVWNFSAEAMIPSGVTLSTAESGNGKVVKSVDSFWSIRSIAWIGLTENGELIPVSETRPLEMLDGYAAVHGHEFLVENEDDIAENITETLSNNYDSKYSFSCEKNRVTDEKKGSDAKLDIEIYTYKKINGELVH